MAAGSTSCSRVLFFAADDGGTNEVVFHSQNHPVTSILSFLVSYHSSPSAVR